MSTWVPVLGFSGSYAVSDEGQVKSFMRSTPRVLNGFTDNFGYRVVRLFRGTTKADSVVRRVHVVVARAFLGVRPEGAVIRHLDGDHLNNAAVNLAYGTVTENVHDTIAQGRHAEGEQSHFARLTESMVHEIRRAYVPGAVSMRELGERYGVSGAGVRLITRGKTWASLVTPGWSPIEGDFRGTRVEITMQLAGTGRQS